MLLHLYKFQCTSSWTSCVPSLQRDTTGLSNENTELKLRLQAMEQQAQLRDGMFQLSTFKQTFSNFYPVLHTQY